MGLLWCRLPTQLLPFPIAQTAAFKSDRPGNQSRIAIPDSSRPPKAAGSAGGNPSARHSRSHRHSRRLCGLPRPRLRSRLAATRRGARPEALPSGSRLTETWERWSSWAKFSRSPVSPGASATRNARRPSASIMQWQWSSTATTCFDAGRRRGLGNDRAGKGRSRGTTGDQLGGADRSES